MLKNAVICLLAMLTGIGAAGQDLPADTVVELKTFTVTALRERVLAVGQAVLSIDSLERIPVPSAALSDLLPGKTSLHIKNYGSGSLTTLSLRGTSANHTGLVWNGIPLSPPNIGYVDLSMVRAGFFDRIRIAYGGASPLYGSGFIGGTIHLETMPVFGLNVMSGFLGQSAGSFGTSDLRAGMTLSKDRVFSRTEAFWKASRNDFPYTDLAGERQELEHAGMSVAGVMQDVAVRLKGGQSLQALGWFQYADRNIPPTLTEAGSEANQVDRSLRLLIAWKDVGSTRTLEAKAAYFNEFTRYSDPASKVYSTIATQTALAQFESSWSLFSFSRLYAGASFTGDYADLLAYEKPASELTGAVFASFLQPFPSIGWEMAVHARQEVSTAYVSPFIFGLSADGTIAGPLSMQLSFSRNFRKPTLNERYWQPGGNPDLQPELSWNGDLSLVLEGSATAASWQMRAGVFTSLVDDWILWVPDGPLWSVENVLEVWARGIELTAAQEVAAGSLRFAFDESYSCTRSTSEKSLGANDASYGKQLIYVPVHQAAVNLSLGWRTYTLSLRNSYTGEVYTTKDNQNSLPAYYLADLALSGRFHPAARCHLDISLKVNNLTNADYQVTPYRPMPGVNFIINANFTLHYSK